MMEDILVNENIKTESLYDCTVPYLKKLFKSSIYPWEILSEIRNIINELIKTGIEGFSEIKEGIFIGENVRISDKATLNAPCIIGHNTEIRPGAYIRGNLITGEGCVLGNSSEFKNAILLNNVQLPHYNYVGDSILGNGTHMGAGALCSNLKSDGKTVIIHAENDISTNLRKVGGFLADGVDVGSHSVINPGTVIGKNSSVYPMTSVRGVIDSDCIVKSMQNIVKRK